MVNFFKKDPAPRPPRKRLKPMSEKRKAVQVQRSAFVVEQLSRRRICEAGVIIGNATGDARPFAVASGEVRWRGCLYASQDMHEPLTRARAPGPETILDEKNSVAICRGCHEWVHAHPAEAERIGLLRSSRGK